LISDAVRYRSSTCSSCRAPILLPFGPFDLLSPIRGGLFQS
jgi:hypothetical protein